MSGRVAASTWVSEWIIYESNNPAAKQRIGQANGK